MGNTPSKTPHGVSMWNTDNTHMDGDNNSQSHLDNHHLNNNHHYDDNDQTSGSIPDYLAAHQNPLTRNPSNLHHHTSFSNSEHQNDAVNAHDNPATYDSSQQKTSFNPSISHNPTARSAELDGHGPTNSHQEYPPAPPPPPQEHAQSLSREPSKAVQVPVSSNTSSHPVPTHSMHSENLPATTVDPASDAISPSGPPASSYYGILQRPPWMPLPIGDADTAPGSPIIADADDTTITQPLIDDDCELASVPPLDDTSRAAVPGGITTSQPIISDSTEQLDAGTQEDDEMEDELDSYPLPTGSDKFSTVAAAAPPAAVVPTTIEWHGHGDNVFVTGTFVNWGRKFRLRPSEREPSVMSVVLKLREGTHHLKFIVDNVMRTSYKLPTAVDFTNHLVNYIEVAPPRQQKRASDAGAAAAAATTTAATATGGDASSATAAAHTSGTRNLNENTAAAEAAASQARTGETPIVSGHKTDLTSSDITPSSTGTVPSTLEPVQPESRPPTTIPAATATTAVTTAIATAERQLAITTEQDVKEEGEEEGEEEEEEQEQPLADTRVVIPQLLEDIDVDEDSPSYQQAANVISEMTTPPTLPLFLAKSILNGHTPAKDDNSVLNYPNHT
ncbi:hypothetical protein KEM54_000669, partial [Ascosphaera aggregata]